MNATVSEINTEFLLRIAKRGFYKSLVRGNDLLQSQKTCNRVKTIRRRLKHGLPVTIDLKIKWLMLSGWRPDSQKVYTQKEVVCLITKAIKASKEVKSMGAEFVLEHIQKSDW